jgi:hypothetical protein
MPGAGPFATAAGSAATAARALHDLRVRRDDLRAVPTDEEAHGMPTCEQFFWGFAGSLAVEVVTLFHLMQRSEREIRLPARYRSPTYWLVRCALAAVGGGLAVAYDIESKILAANIGAATPAIIETLTRGSRLGSLPRAA